MVDLSSVGSLDQVLQSLTVVNLTVTGTETINSTETVTGNLSLGANLLFTNAAALIEGPKTAGNTLTLQGYNSTSAAYVNLFTVTTGNPPTLTFTSSLSGNLLLAQSTANYTLQWNNPGAARTLTIADPGGAGTFGYINAAQTWAALQTFGTNISIGGVTATGATGTGNVVFATSPTITTPVITGANAGVAYLSNGGSALLTATPNAAMLEVAHDTAHYNVGLAVRLLNTNDSAGGGPSFGLAINPTGGPKITVQLFASKTNGTVGDYTTDLVFQTHNGTSLAERMRLLGSGNLSITDGGNVVIGTTTGTQIGTATTQKLGFFGATPVVQITGGTDVLASLVTLGLRAASANPPLNLGSGALAAGASTLAATTVTTLGTAGLVTLADGNNVAVGSTTGTQFGTATTQKLGFFGTAPVVQQTGASDVLGSLVTLGLRAASSNPPLNLGTGALTAGATSLGLTTTTGRRVAVAAKTAAYTLTTADSFVTGDATTAAFAITLPASAGNGQRYVVKKIDSSANAVTLTAAGADTIDGAATKALSQQFQSVTVVDGVSGKWSIE